MTTQTLYPVANSVGPTQVRESDDAYIIEDVPFIRPMELAGGYVPEQNVRETASAWDGVPATLNHPRDDSGRPVAANEKPETHLGITGEPHYDGTHVRGNIRLSKDRLEDLGDEAEDIEEALEAGDPIEVSSQYASVDAPAGEYDGEYRANVERIIRPDSVAILPNGTGVCSVEDGCGINPQMAANSALSLTMAANADAKFSKGDLLSWSWSDGTAHGRVTDVFVDEGTITRTIDGTEVSKDSDDAPVYAVEVWRGLADDADGEGEFDGMALRKEGNRDLSAWEDPPDSVTEMGAAGNDGSMSDNSLVTAFRTLWRGLSGSQADDGSLPEDLGDSGAVTANNSDGVDRKTLIDDIVSNSALSESALEARCDEGLQAIHDDVMSENDDSDDSDDSTNSDTDTDMSDNPDNPDDPADDPADDKIGLDDLTDEAVDEIESRVQQRVEANRAEEQKEELATEIIANSADYDSDDRETLLDTPLGVLEDLHSQATSGTAGVPGSGVSGNADAGSTGGGESTDEYPDGVLH
jgi:hypothetical protein